MRKAVSRTSDAPRSELEWERGENAETDPPEVRERRRVEAVADQVLRFVSSDRFKMPMLPQAAVDALAIANEPKTSPRQLQQVIAADPVLAARVFAVANSSIYGLQVRTLTQSVMRLGTGMVRDILYQAVAEAHFFRGRAAAALSREREHAVGVAMATRLLCTHLRLDSEFAFVCGLMHDIGRTVLMEFMQHNRPPGALDHEIDLVIHRLHAFVGARVASRWGLPDRVSEACRRHHVYRDWSEEPGGYSQVGNMVAVADRLGYHLGAGRPVQWVDFEEDRAYDDLGLDPGAIAGFLATLEQQRRAT